MRTARFWIWHRGGYVKLSIPAGHKFTHFHADRHEEGWSIEETSWEFDGHKVTIHAETDGTDCDGRLSSSDVLTCPVSRLRDRVPHAGVVINDDRWDVVQKYNSVIDGEIRLPAFDYVSQSQRDYAAERAGY